MNTLSIHTLNKAVKEINKYPFKKSILIKVPDRIDQLNNKLQHKALSRTDYIVNEILLTFTAKEYREGNRSWFEWELVSWE